MSSQVRSPKVTSIMANGGRDKVAADWLPQAKGGGGAHHRQDHLLSSMALHGEREAVVLLGSQQCVRGPGRRAHQRFGARQGLQEHAVGEMRQRPRPRPLCSHAGIALACSSLGVKFHAVACCRAHMTSPQTLRCSMASSNAVPDMQARHCAAAWLLLMRCLTCRPEIARTKDDQALLLHDNACLPGNTLPHSA